LAAPWNAASEASGVANGPPWIVKTSRFGSPARVAVKVSFQPDAGQTPAGQFPFQELKAPPSAVPTHWTR
jgi:hypothetical protein